MATADVSEPGGTAGIAVLADQALVDALRLAGASHCLALPAQPGNAGKVDEVLREWLASDELLLIVIGAEHAALASERIAAFRHSKRLTPVIVAVPSRDGAWEADSTRYYQQLSRDFLGLEVVLAEDAAAAEDPGADAVSDR